jgi:hypothetical protein
MRAWPYGNKLRQIFDAEFYLRKYPDVAAAGVDPFLHYLEFGATEGRKPHPLFDPEYYLVGRGRAESLRAPPLVEFLKSSGESCINPHPLFDCASYLSAHPDATNRRLNPFLHYLLSRRAAAPARSGLAELPFPSACFTFMDVLLRIVFPDRVHVHAVDFGEDVVPVWQDSSGKMGFIAPPQQRPFFEAMKYDQLRAQVSSRP